MDDAVITACNKRFSLIRFFIVIMFFLFGMALTNQTAYASQVVLNWGAATDPAITGYKIYYGTASGYYTHNIDVGSVTTYTISNLAIGATYYFAVTCHDAAGNESDFSNEVVAAIPAGQQYTLAVSKAGTGTGTVSGAGINCGTVCSGSFAAGTDVVLTATAATGSVFSGWTGGGGSGTGTYETIVNAATNVTATFTKNYSITASAGAGGSISPAGTTTLNSGGSQTYTITPSAGYSIASVTVDGASVGAVSSYTFSSVTASHAITANFAATSNTITITSTAGTGGSISPSGSLIIAHGASKTYTIRPATGYAISDIEVDGVSIGAVSRYTFRKVTASHTITATFAAKSYTITSAAGTGGSISPSGSSIVTYGASKTYTITPATGYAILRVKVGGTSVGAVSSYTFSKVTANRTITATFVVKKYVIKASTGTGGRISPSGSSIVTYGASKTYTITPATGYAISDVKVDGTSVGAVSGYTFSNVTAGHTITATFVAKK